MNSIIGVQCFNACTLQTCDCTLAIGSHQKLLSTKSLETIYLIGYIRQKLHDIHELYDCITSVVEMLALKFLALCLLCYVTGEFRVWFHFQPFVPCVD